MTTPEDQNGLREALARVFHEVISGHYAKQGWPLAEFEEDGGAWWRRADILIAGPFASLIAERDAAVSKAALDENAAAAWKRKAQEAECTINDLAGIDQRAAEYCRERDDALASLRAAEAEITRLKEGMEAVVGALKLAEKPLSYRNAVDPNGPGSFAVARALDAVRSALATLSPKEYPHG